MQALANHANVALFGFEGVESTPQFLIENVAVERDLKFFLLSFLSRKSKLVLIAVRVHPFPSRTRKLSSLAPKILVWRRTGKIGNANIGGIETPQSLCYTPP